MTNASNFFANRSPQIRSEEARKVFTLGVELTRRLGQKHAESELTAALESLD